MDTTQSRHPEAERTHAEPQEPPSRRKLRWTGFGALLLAILLAGIGIFWRHEHAQQVQQWTQEQAIPTVSLLTPGHGPSTFDLILPGDVQAWYEAPIYARVNGYLKYWYFDYGAEVKKGQVLAEIDAPDLDAQFAAAKSRLKAAQHDIQVKQAQEEFARTTYERWKSSPTGVVSEQERQAKWGDYGSAFASLNAAKAIAEADQNEVDRLNAMEGFKLVIAPFDGFVTARKTDIGDLINAGSGIGGGNGPELFRVADVHEMRVYVPVPQQMTAGIHQGLTAELRLPQFNDRTFKATVATTARSIAMSSRTLLVELHAANPDGLLQPGAYAEVDFKLAGNPDVAQIPASALLFREHGLQVATVGPDDKVALKRVTLGRNLGIEVEVERGLTASDRVIDSPPDSIESGDLVHVAGEQAKPAARERTAETSAATRTRTLDPLD
jgi:RND family efflux transporter MFP subunit